MSLAKKYGAPLETLIPNNSDLSHEEYVYYRRLGNFPEGSFTQGLPYSVKGYVTTDLTADGLKQGIMAGNGLSILVRLGKEWWTDRNGSYTTNADDLFPLRAPKEIVSGEERLLRAIFGDNAKDVKDTSLRMPNGKSGKVVDVKIFTRESGHDLRSDVLMQVQVFVAHMAKVEVGDKFAGRYGNKGTIAKILPIEDMPFTKDGQPIDMVLTPLGVPSRMNLGQVFEMHLSLAAKALGYKVASPSFNRVTTAQIKEELKKAGYKEDGKVQLFDGRTGEPFEEQTAIGYMHMLKLEHMIEGKIHARSIGPYTKVTQQPLGGKAQFGGQRFGEMEVWALEAFGVANILQEMLTIKSDDMVGRSKAYESLVKSRKIVGPRLPESFKVLVSELQGIGLDVQLIGDKYEQATSDSSSQKSAQASSNDDAVVEAEDVIEEETQSEAPVSSEVEEAINQESSLGPNDIDVSGLSSDFSEATLQAEDEANQAEEIEQEIEAKQEEEGQA
jgi:DNA-directed RNA polymerase subunit beta